MVMMVVMVMVVAAIPRHDHDFGLIVPRVEGVMMVMVVVMIVRAVVRNVVLRELHHSLGLLCLMFIERLQLSCRVRNRFQEFGKRGRSQNISRRRSRGGRGLRRVDSAERLDG